MNNDCLYELPFNHDLNFFELYSKTEKHFAKHNIQINKLIDFVYLPAFYLHSRNSREEASTSIFMPRCWCEYKRHIYLLKERLNVRLGILLQQPNLEISIDIIKQYEDLGVDLFIVNSDMTADIIKTYNPSLTTIASVTKKLTYEDYLKKNLSMYDRSCLDFSFERGIIAIEKLPNVLKYSMIINNKGCLYNCKNQDKHWFLGIRSCNRYINQEEKLCIIYPKDLEYFKPYIHSFKIQGRDLNIKNSFETFTQYVLCETSEKHDLYYFNSAIRDNTISIV